MKNESMVPTLGRILAGLALSAILVCAQAIDSNLVGTVTDSSGAAVPKSQVTAANKDTGVRYNASTDGVGQYRINHLPVGVYDVTAAAQDFALQTTANVNLQLNHTATANFQLLVATQAASVQVIAAPPPLDLATSQLQITFDSRSLADVPAAAAGSGYLNLSLLGAGVASSGGVGLGYGPSVGGQRPSNNRFYVDGADNNSYYAPGPLGYVPNEALAEFTLLQNHFGSEFGGASGGIFNSAVKSGGNQVHGSLYEYLQNKNLMALDAVYARQGLTSPPRYDSNRLGATIGGPIIKNRLFYFGNFEYTPIGRAVAPPSTVLAPTAAGYQTLDGLGGISKTNLQVLQRYLAPAPIANGLPIAVAGASIPVGSISVVAPSYANVYSAIGSVDWDIRAKDRVRGRYILSKIDSIDTATTLPVFFVPAPSTTHLISLSEFHNFPASAENELRWAYSRNFNRRAVSDLAFPGLDAFPTISLQDLSLTLGPDPLVPSGTIQDESQVAENFTKMWRRHTFKTGYEIHDIILSSATVSFPRGNYRYANLNEYLQDFAPSLGGQRTLGTNGPILNGIPVGFLQNAAYFNDDFRVRSNLTVNLGVRYEFVTVPVAARAQRYSAAFSVPGVITFGEPQPTKNDWSPRIGFAYSPGRGGVWSIRGGFSRAFDMPYANIASNTLPTFYGAVKNATPGTANFLASGGLNSTLTPGITTYSPDQRRPYAVSYTFSVQRLLGKDYTIEARYLGTRGVHLLVQEQINRVGVVTPTRSIPVFFSTPTPAQLAALPYTVGDLRSSNNPLAAYPGLGSAITAYLPVGNSKYNGLALQLTKRYSKNLSYIAAYTWSHALDDSTATVSTTVLTPRRPQDPLNLRAEWASSMLDRRHRFTMTPIYDFTPFRHSNWFLRNIVGNWNVSSTYTFESPEYATVQSNIDSNLSGDSVGDRAIVNTGGIANIGSGVTAYDRSGKVISLASPTAAITNGIAAYVVNNPNARYILAGPGAYANGGRNTFRLAPINNFDASLRKGLNLGETKRFEIGAQFYNLLNHPQYVAGYTSDVAPLKTTAPSFSNFLTPGNSTFGQYQQVFPSNSRWVQLVARLTF